MNKKRALITGVTGQDGIYLSKFLLKKGYEVHGLIRSKSDYDRQIVSGLGKNLRDKMFFHKGDLRKGNGIDSIIKRIKPAEIYNLGAISNVDIAEKKPANSYNINFLGVLRILESIKKFSPKTKLFQAGSSMQFSLKNNERLNEKSKQNPSSVYGKSKQLAYKSIKEYREKYGIFACCGFMANHESFLRDGRALSKIIIKNIVRYSRKEISYFYLYNIDYKRDWGHAEDFVCAMWLMLQNDIPEDFIIAANNFKTIRNFCTTAFKFFGIDIIWTRAGKYEYAKNKTTGKILIKSKLLPRKQQIDYTISFNKIKSRLNWNPKIKFQEIVNEMIRKEIKYF